MPPFFIATSAMCAWYCAGSIVAVLTRSTVSAAPPKIALTHAPRRRILFSLKHMTAIAPAPPRNAAGTR